MAEKLANVGGGTGNSIQEMPLIPGQVDSTAGAADIDTTDMTLIYICGACDVYIESETTKTIPVAATSKFTVDKCDSIHVSAAIKYAWV